MGRIIPVGSIPDKQTYPDNIYRVTVEKLEAVQTKDAPGKHRKLMYKVTFRIIEPSGYANQYHWEQYCIGSEDDPDAEQLATWQTTMGAREFKKFLRATGLPLSDEEDEDTLPITVRGAELLLLLIENVEPTKNRDGTPNRYAGQVSNRVKAYYKLGEREPGSLEAATPKLEAPRRPPLASVKSAPSDLVTCVSCREQVPRKDLRAHAQKHINEPANADDGEE